MLRQVKAWTAADIDTSIAKMNAGIYDRNHITPVNNAAVFAKSTE